MQTPKDPSAWHSLIGIPAPHPILFSLEMIKRENIRWFSSFTYEHPGYLGQADSIRPPGNIDPAKSIIIADLGDEQMIALDYRESEIRPTVLLFKNYRDGTSRWIKIAPDIEAFIHALCLDAPTMA